MRGRRRRQELGEALAREAMRILADLVPVLHVRRRRGRAVEIEALVSGVVFDRLCLWDAAAEDLEQDPDGEDGGDAEEEDFS